MADMSDNSRLILVIHQYTHCRPKDPYVNSGEFFTHT